MAVLVGADNLYVFTPKRDRQSAVLCQMVRSVVSSTDSLGVNGEFWRRTNTRNVLAAWARKKTDSAKSGTWSTATLNLAAHHPNATAGTQLDYQTTSTNGDYIEYSVDIGSSGKFTLGFYKTGITTLSATVSVPADVGFTPVVVSTRRSGATSEIAEVEFTYQPGTHTIRVTHTGAGGAPLYLFGANFRSILSDNQFDSGSGGYDSYAWVRDNNEYTSGNGANDYAIYSKTDALWGGSYHGGETATTPAAFTMSGQAVTLSTGVPVMGVELSIQQETAIEWATETINTASTTRFYKNGEVSLDVQMTGSVVCEKFMAGMNAAYATQSAGSFTGGFSEMTTPTEASYSSGENPLPISEIYIQRNPTTGQTITSRITAFPDYSKSTHEAPFIWATTAGPYFKLYNAPIYEYTTGETLTSATFNYTVEFA